MSPVKEIKGFKSGECGGDAIGLARIPMHLLGYRYYLNRFQREQPIVLEHHLAWTRFYFLQQAKDLPSVQTNHFARSMIIKYAIYTINFI